jgi:hypothetical protein
VDALNTEDHTAVSEKAQQECMSRLTAITNKTSGVAGDIKGLLEDIKAQVCMCVCVSVRKCVRII